MIFFGEMVCAAVYAQPAQIFLRGAKKAVWVGDQEGRLGVNTYGYAQDFEQTISAAYGNDLAPIHSCRLNRNRVLYLPRPTTHLFCH